MRRKAVVALIVALSGASAFAAPASAAGWPQTNVINGLEAAPGSFPYMALVVFENSTEAELCSGTVVSANVVLTAAHCVLDRFFNVLRNPANLTVITGNVNWAAGQRTVSSVSRVAVAPTFSYLTPSYTVFRGDAAVLGLSQPIAAPSVRLATSQLCNPGSPTVELGWGRTEANEEPPTTLHAGEGAVQAAGFCKSEFSHFDEGSLICTLDYPSYRYTTCNGDSGGPLLMVAPGTTNEPIEIGITSFGQTECPTEAPAYFTRVDSVAPWVQQKIAEYAPPPPAPPPVSTPPTPTPVPSPQPPKLPRLTPGAAGRFATTALREGLSTRFKGRHEYKVRCSEVDETKQKCFASWWLGATDYWGYVTIYYAFEGGKVVWNRRYTIKAVNDYCYYHSGRRTSCPVRVFRR